MDDNEFTSNAMQCNFNFHFNSLCLWNSIFNLHSISLEYTSMNSGKTPIFFAMWSKLRSKLKSKMLIFDGCYLFDVKCLTHSIPLCLCSVFSLFIFNNESHLVECTLLLHRYDLWSKIVHFPIVFQITEKKKSFLWWNGGWMDGWMAVSGKTSPLM